MNRPGERMVPMIVHVDGDNFFVSCELMRFPHLHDTPVVVGAERGIATAMNPHAKRIGITRGMPVFQIRREFPQTTILPAHFELYEKYATNLFQLLSEELDYVERYSIDECFGVMMIPAARYHDRDYLSQRLQTLQTRVNTTLGITYSFGLAPTKTLAKVASKKNKPNGCCVITDSRDDILRSLDGSSIESIWGIGRRLSSRLQAMNIRTAIDFITTDSTVIARYFARPVVDTWHELSGDVRLAVTTTGSDYQSMQSTQSFPKTNDRSYISAELSRHAEILAQRMRKSDYRCQNYSLFLKYQVGTQRRYVTTEYQTDYPTNDAPTIIRAMNDALESILEPRIEYKAAGITAMRIRPVDSLQMDLFGTMAHNESKNVGLLMDTINDTLGAHTIIQASSLRSYNQRTYDSVTRNTINRYEYGLPLPYLGEVR